MECRNELRKTSGFTHIRLVVAIVIVSIIISIIAMAVPSLIHYVKIRKAKAMLERVDYSIEGYISANGHCPCPDTDRDGMENRNDSGTPDDPTDDACTAYIGNLPYLTLGFSSGEDNWYNHIKYIVYEDLIKTTLSTGNNDYCYKLRDIINYYRTNVTDTNKLYTILGSENANQAYVIVTDGLKDLDVAGGFLKGFHFEFLNKITAKDYNDLLRAVSFNDLRGRRCGGGVENSYPNGCTNAIDDDGDLMIDCNDPDCADDPACLQGGDNARIVTISIPSGTVNSGYSATLTASGGITPYEWDLIDNGGFTDLYLHSYTGCLSGTLSLCPGDHLIQVKLVDFTEPTISSDIKSFNLKVTKDLSIVRTSGGKPDNIIWDSTDQEETFEIHGGHIGDIEWTLDTGGASGFVCEGSGDTAYIKKDGITTAGIYTFILTATDHACSANTANIIFMVTVTKPVFSDSYAEGLESEWNMDECSWDGTAGEVADSSEGGSHSGTAKDGAFTTGSGKICRCASTDGGKASILLDPVLDIGADWTIATWFYWPLANTGSAYWTLTGGTNDHQILVNRASKLLGTYDTEVGTGWHSGGFNMAKLSKGWHHITAIGAGVKTKFYIDGVLKGTAGYKSETDIKTLGNNCTGGSQNWGKFDEMKVWSKVLTEDEIINLCSATRASCSGTCYSDPIAEYRMENHAWNGTAGEVLDSSSGDSNGVAVSGGSGVMPSQTTRSGGKVCEAGVFTRVDANNGGYLDLGDPGDGDLDPGNDLWTISTWIKWDGSSGDNIIFNKEKLYETRVKDGYVNYAWQPRWAWSGGKSLPVTANEWTYITTVYDGSRQILYKNGAEVYSRPQAGVMGSNGNKFLIGARVRGDAPPISFFGGMIDEVKIYNRALSENEIQADKNETRDCAADSAVINTTTVLNGSPSISPSAPITFSCDTADFYRDFTVSVPRPGALADWAITWLGTNPGGFEVVKTGDATVRFRKISTSTAGNGYQFKLTANNSSSTDNPIESGYYTLNISSGASGTRYHAGCVADWRLDESSGTIKDHSGQNNDGKTYGGVTYGAPGKVWTALKFDGTSGYVNCGNNTSLNILAGDFTVGAWIKPASHISKAGQRYTIMANYSPGWILDLSCDDNGTKEGYRFYSGKTVYKYTPPGGRFSLDWTHFIVTRNSKTKELKLYLNGELKRSWNKTTVGASTNSVLIGKRTDGSWFNGIIDEAQIYNRELSAAEITDLYNRDRP